MLLAGVLAAVYLFEMLAAHSPCWQMTPGLGSPPWLRVARDTEKIVN